MAAKSYTQWSTFKKCPAQYKHRYVEKLPTPPSSAAAQRGTNLHGVVEQLLQGKIDAIPFLDDGAGNNIYAPLEPYEDFFKMLKDKGAVAELGFLLNHDWEPCEEGEPVHVRGYIDIIVPPSDGHIYIYELKTGKEYDDHVEQRNFYGAAALGLAWDQEVEKVTVYGTYMDLGEMRENTYAASMQSTYKYFWNQKLEQMDNEQALVPNPGFYCRWCPFSKDKGGPCKFSGS